MENAADALKIAFAVFVFVIAITVTFSVISQAKSTADYVLYYSDKTNYYNHLNSKETNRTVSVSEVVSNLHRYYEESMGIKVKFKSGETYLFDLNNEENPDGKIELNSDASRERNIEDFIKDKLLILPEETKFTEEFVEVPISGIYKRGEDDTEIVISSGGKKVYITYSQQ